MLIPNFGKSHTIKTNKRIAVIIRKIVFDRLSLTLLGISILLVLLLSFLFKNGRINDIANIIKINKSISRAIKIVSQF